MAHFPQQRDRLQPSETFFDALPLLLADSIAAWRVVRASMALPPLRPLFCATCGVTPRWRHSATKSAVSYPLSPPTVTGFVPGICSSMTSAAWRSAVPLASNTSASTINPFRSTGTLNGGQVVNRASTTAVASANLTALATYCGHICGEIKRCGRFGRWYLLSSGVSLVRLIYNPLRKLVWITRTFALADGHEIYDAIGRMLKRDCGYSN